MVNSGGPGHFPASLSPCLLPPLAPDHGFEWGGLIDRGEPAREWGHYQAVS
jgi:hypothetical protein